MSKANSSASVPEPDEQTKYEIILTKKQYFALLKTVYLGNWVANAIRDDSDSGKRLDEYDVAESTIFSYAKQFGYSQYIDDEFANEGKYYPTRVFEDKTEVMALIDEYNEDTFWDELVEHLAERDFKKQYNRAEARAMSQEEHINKLYEFIDKWAEEINANGLDNIGIIGQQS